jgi:hypothetical protein
MGDIRILKDRFSDRIGMNPFERHNIRHLSPSSLALYRAAPALWCLRYLFGVRDEAAAYGWRGKAVEAAVDAIVFENASDDAAIRLALTAFEVDAHGELSAGINRERNALPDMVRRAGAIFRRLGRPVARQQKVEVWIDGIEIPVIGFADYLYPEFVLDLKTTFAVPSIPRPDHEAQVVCYSDALSRRPGLIYVSPRRSMPFPHSMIDEAGARRLLRQSAHAVRAMLAATDTRENAAAFFVPVVHDFRWTDLTRNAAEKVWA